MLKKDLLTVGTYSEAFDEVLENNFQDQPIFQSKGLEKHVEKRHPNCLEYLKQIPNIIRNPDYIGKHPKEPHSFELVKIFDENIQIAIKLDYKNNYLYVATLHEIKTSKIENRLNSGRLKKFKKD